MTTPTPDQIAQNESLDDDLAEVVARKVAPFVCRPVYNGDNDDVAAGISHAYYVAREVLSALDLPARLQAAKDAGREEALAEVVTTRTRAQHGKHCCCTTCELNEAEDAIRERIGKP